MGDFPVVDIPDRVAESWERWASAEIARLTASSAAARKERDELATVLRKIIKFMGKDKQFSPGEVWVDARDTLRRYDDARKATTAQTEATQ